MSKKSEVIDLKSCPFCGSVTALRLKNTHTPAFWIECDPDEGGCFAQVSGEYFPGPRRKTRFNYYPEATDGDECSARTLAELHPEYSKAAKSAIATWNRRSPEARDDR